MLNLKSSVVRYVLVGGSLGMLLTTSAATITAQAATRHHWSSDQQGQQDGQDGQVRYRFASDQQGQQDGQDGQVRYRFASDQQGQQDGQDGQVRYRFASDQQGQQDGQDGQVRYRFASDQQGQQDGQQNSARPNTVIHHTATNDSAQQNNQQDSGTSTITAKVPVSVPSVMAQQNDQQQTGTSTPVTKTPVSQPAKAPTKAPTTATSSSSHATTASLPPGVRYDYSITPVAGLNATWQQKFDAVLQVAQSKLGTPYIWGHNEDRGQYGFDCSNFTAYVYHHALGYHFSGASRVQASSVGRTVPISDMRPGDLLIDDYGHHVGIYVGNGRMIQEGGGLKKVGYLRVTPGSYWYNHITAVKRMF